MKTLPGIHHFERSRRCGCALGLRHTRAVGRRSSGIAPGIDQTAFRAGGIQVVGEASNGLEAIELVRQVRPDVVVMDISMPQMDGIEATRRIKAEWPDVRVIGLPMFEEEQIAQTMFQAGAEAFMSKTTSSAKLLEAVHRVPVQPART